MTIGFVAGCASTPQHAVPIAIVIGGDRATLAHIATLHVPGLAIEEVGVPETPPPPPPPTATLARARQAYANGNFDTCRQEVRTLEVIAMLATGARASAAKALTLEAACAWGSLARDEAGVAAAQLAGFGLDSAGLAIPPDLEGFLDQQLVAAGTRPHFGVAIGGVTGARLAVDGRDPVCTLPCTVDLARGDHVLAVASDGYADAARLVRVNDAAHIELAQAPAEANLAAGQWRARLGRGLPPADRQGAALIAQFAKRSRIAYLHADSRLTGTLIIDGRITAVGERGLDQAEPLLRDLAYDARVLPRPAVWRKPWFWIAVSGAVALVAGVAIAIVYTPPKHTAVGL